MHEPLEEAYFKWLYSRVASVRLTSPSRTWWSLLRQLHKKEFVWTVHNDDNREADGKDLRIDFLDAVEVREDATVEWMSAPCSMLEMLIALSRRLEFESEDDEETDDWFWHILRNLNLDEYTDRYYKNKFTEQLVDDVLRKVNQRDYEYSGEGGLFPLQYPQHDQREVELWFQAAAYLNENDPV